MTTFRLLRSPCIYQICLRGLSTEPAVATFQPPKVAVRTPKNDPTSHTKEDIGKLYTMPQDVRNKLFFPKHTLPIYFKRLTEMFGETNIVVREPAVELIDYLSKADYNRPIIRYAIYGKYGCGKTLTLIHLLNYAYNNNFIVVYIPRVWDWLHWSREVVSAERDPTIFDLPLDAAHWLKHFEVINSQLITNLDLRVSKTYQWTQRDQTAEGAPLNELVSYGINRVKYSCQVVDALLNELKIHSSAKRCKTFAGIDGYNGFLQTSSILKTGEHVRMIPGNVSLTRSFLSFVKNDWTNGAAVLIIDLTASVKGEYSSHLPFHLLRKVGVESIDPFIPIHIPEYTPLEFHNYLDYLEEMRWLQKPQGRDEIEFVTHRNPKNVNTYCANR